MSSKTLIMAHDMGTSRNKATIIDLQGRILGKALDNYEIEYPQTHWAQQNPEDWWDAICKGSRRVLEESGTKPDEIVGSPAGGLLDGVQSADEPDRPDAAAGGGDVGEPTAMIRAGGAAQDPGVGVLDPPSVVVAAVQGGWRGHRCHHGIGGKPMPK